MLKNKPTMASLPHGKHMHICVACSHAVPTSPALTPCKIVKVLPPKKRGCSALLEMCLSHLRQEGTCGGGLVALKSACLTNCGSSAESVAQRGAATSAAGFDTAAYGRQRMRHEGKARQIEDLHPTGEPLWSVAI